MKDLWLMTTAGLLGTAVLAAPAVARTPAIVAAEDALAEVPCTRATDVLEAQGTGTARLVGDGSVRGSVSGGTLTVTGAENLWVGTHASRRSLPSGAMRYEGVEGEFQIWGEAVHLELRARHMRFTAAGVGVASLNGIGSHWVDGHPAGAWPGAETPVKLG